MCIRDRLGAVMTGEKEMVLVQASHRCETPTRYRAVRTGRREEHWRERHGRATHAECAQRSSAYV
eukprot:1795659-Prymnesium_polylepis.1